MDEVKVLLVDDEPRNLDALESILTGSECSLVRAESADQALLALLNNEFAAIVLDIKMPGVSGVDLARLIKQRKRTQHVPILFLTAHMLDERDVLEAYGVGGVDYLNKPINPDILRSKVAVFVNLFKTTRALASAVEALHAEISQRQNVQEELRLAKDQLELRVRERTAELERANREIRDNQERLRLALAVAQVATWEWDLTTGKVRWSTDPEIVFGFPAGSFGPSSRISRAAHPEDVELLDAAIRQALATGDFQAEYRAVRPDGTVLWIADRGRVMPDGNGQPARIVGVSVDLTTRKVAEEALRENDRRKDEFLATLAHELRNPLAPIRYAVAALDLKGNNSPDVQRTVRIIDRQAKQMARLIDDLLDVNRITRNTLELRREHVELARIIEAAVETSRPLIEESGQELTVEVPSNSIVLDADFTRLAQVFSNLLNNAAKYGKVESRKGQITLTVRMDTDYVRVAVRDTGMGIAKAMLPKVFDMFTQIGESRGGLGIGLSLAKRLAEMHGGTITADSEGLNLGSEFAVELPVVATIVPQISSDKVEGMAVASKSRVLLADDNVDIVESFEVMLQSLGYEVATATSGYEAIEKAEAFRPDAILLDIGMPGMDGYETARRIREHSWGKDIVLVAITGWGQDKDKRRSDEAGFDAHLVKPIDVPTIVGCLETTARRGAVRRVVTKDS